ncbi:aldehyde dehydrogenase [Paenibacillus sp. PvR098]|uniref:aldehyde dehydrogenase n=1 Tax=unclassified Paenibacillus TaxID=185978 RepID=UPI001B66147D|nr:aldehyde dehydrogenase (NAD+) [Paenibacillus sp. PvP091]MBP1168775.1 aldehyde dehydrogenase (NAD+) [Paenibacillus sp. PvR098]MBP2439803.1 aldehyde dehydrogenase (NAD+) [Paenibacillus sp. PvP052]
MTIDYKMLINGQWVESSTKERFPSSNPYNQEIWATIPQASEDDVSQAIDGARKAFDTSWRKVSGLQRAQLLMKLADLLDDNAARIAALETTDNGKVIRETKNQMHFAARNYRFFAGYADKLNGEVIPLDNPSLFDYTLREPLGVAVLITSWNSPIALLTNKLAPALAAGNTVVIKPSEHTSATTLEIGKLIQQAGFPDGVVNVVTGDHRVGHFLTLNPNVNKISFTGGAETGKTIARNASQNLIPVTLELGGKSPNIIFEDADIHAAVIGAVAGIYGASGQTCIAGSRLLVQRSVYDEVIQKVVDKAKTIRLGNPITPSTEMGPAANKPQYDRILSMIAKGNEDGAKLVYGGHPVSEGELNNGYFIAPTIFVDVKNHSTIAQEEIFGPVLSVIPFEDQEEAVQIANDSKYGLASGIWTSDVKRVHRMARQIQAGTVWVNTYRTSAAQAPFGGVKMSGYGRERGLHALMDYTQMKNVMINLSDDARDPFSMQT